VLERGYGRTIKIPVLNQSRSLGERGSDTLYLAVCFCGFFFLAWSERPASFLKKKYGPEKITMYFVRDHFTIEYLLRRVRNKKVDRALCM
jgi:hypothetical protein